MLHKKPSFRESIAILRTHTAMFGLVSCARATLAYALRPSYRSEQFDVVYGTDTSQSVQIEEAQLPEAYSGEALEYEPTNVPTFQHVMRNLRIPYEQYQFIDLGCGKGRTLLLAADFPFASITGVELSPVTSAIAQRNIDQYLAREANTLRCRNIYVQCGDALTFEIPDADIVFFLYNPFVGTLFRRVIRRIHHAFAMRPGRQALIAYVNPWRGQTDLERSGYFQCIAKHRVIPSNWSWSLWRHRA